MNVATVVAQLADWLFLGLKTVICIFFKNGPFPASFSFFRFFNTVDSKQMFEERLPMAGFEPRISGVRGDRSTTEPQPLPLISISICFRAFISS